MKKYLLIIVTVFITFNLFAAEAEENAFEVGETKKVSIKKLMKEKRYAEALAEFNPDGVQQSHIGVKIVYDVLNTVVNKTNVSSFYCEPQLLQYPKAQVYSMKICSLLVDYKKQGKLSSESFIECKEFVEKNAKQKKYLMDALESLQ